MWLHPSQKLWNCFHFAPWQYQYAIKIQWHTVRIVVDSRRLLAYVIHSVVTACTVIQFFFIWVSVFGGWLTFCNWIIWQLLSHFYIPFGFQCKLPVKLVPLYDSGHQKITLRGNVDLSTATYSHLGMFIFLLHTLTFLVLFWHEFNTIGNELFMKPKWLVFVRKNNIKMRNVTK